MNSLVQAMSEGEYEPPTSRTLLRNLEATCSTCVFIKTIQVSVHSLISRKENSRWKISTSLISSVVLGSKYNSGEQEKVVDQFVNL